MAAETRDTGITRLLASWRDGNSGALERLAPLVYNDLRRIAGSHFRRERAAHTLQPTALVHETYLRLAGECPVAWEGRSHFFGIARRVMRQILIQHSRFRASLKRGGGNCLVSFDEAEEPACEVAVHHDGLNDAMDKLAVADPRKARIVALRFFEGYTNEEVASQLGVSLSTVERELRIALPWLRGRLEPSH